MLLLRLLDLYNTLHVFPDVIFHTPPETQVTMPLLEKQPCIQLFLKQLLPLPPKPKFQNYLFVPCSSLNLQ